MSEEKLKHGKGPAEEPAPEAPPAGAGPDAAEGLRALSESMEAATAAPNPLAQDPELVQDFLVEAREHLAAIEARLLEIEQGVHTQETLHAAFRSFHTIKGLSGFLDYAVMQRVKALADAARALASDETLWGPFVGALGEVSAARATLTQLQRDRDQLFAQLPDLLVATGNAVSLAPEGLITNGPHIERLVLTVDGIQQAAGALAAHAALNDSAQRLTDAERYLGQFIRGLRGEDSTLGIEPVNASGAAAELAQASALFEQASMASTNWRRSPSNLVSSTSSSSSSLKRYSAK